MVTLWAHAPLTLCAPQTGEPKVCMVRKTHGFVVAETKVIVEVPAKVFAHTSTVFRR